MTTLRRLVVVFAILTLALSGCGSAKKQTTLPPANTGPQLRYIAIGASESVGVGTDAPLRDAWPKLVWAAMPVQTVFVDLAVSGSTTADAITQQLPEAIKEKPNVVTIWLNVNDLIAGVTPAQYERELTTMVNGLKSSGASQILVANTPPLDQLPAYLALVNGGTAADNNPFAGHPVPNASQVNAEVDAYNAVIAHIVTKSGVTLVDLHATGLDARTNGQASTLISSDGFHPSTKGAVEVAKTFVAQLKPLT